MTMGLGRTYPLGFILPHLGRNRRFFVIAKGSFGRMFSDEDSFEIGPFFLAFSHQIWDPFSDYLLFIVGFCPTMCIAPIY